MTHLPSQGTISFEPINGSQTVYVYGAAGFNVLGEYQGAVLPRGSNNGATTEHIYLPTASGPMPVAAVIAGEHFAVHADHLNTPRKLSDKSGQARWQWAYSGFGEIGAQSLTTATQAEVRYNLRFPGQVDDQNGLFYNWHRFYHPGTGRYTKADPIGLEGGWNRFAYVGGNPLSGVDPRGLRPTEDYLHDWVLESESWEGALNKARDRKLSNFDASDPMDADNRTAAEHYLFGRYLADGGQGVALQAAYLASGSYWGFGYQAAKQMGFFPRASPASYMQLYWEENAYTDAIGLTRTFSGQPGNQSGGCREGN